MRIFRITVQSLVLVMADVGGIGLGASAAFWIMGSPNQVWLQLPMAVVISLGGFCAWVFALRMLRWIPLQPGSRKELCAWYVASILWAPLVFVPLHYVTQGYLTSLSNLVALALYQLPINALALAGTAALQKKGMTGSAPPGVMTDA